MPFSSAEYLGQTFDSDSAFWRVHTFQRPLFFGLLSCRGCVWETFRHTHSDFCVKTCLRMRLQPCFHWNFSDVWLYYIETFRYYTNVIAAVFSLKCSQTLKTTLLQLGCFSCVHLLWASCFHCVFIVFSCVFMCFHMWLQCGGVWNRWRCDDSGG